MGNKKKSGIVLCGASYMIGINYASKKMYKSMHAKAYDLDHILISYRKWLAPTTASLLTSILWSNGGWLVPLFMVAII